MAANAADLADATPRTPASKDIADAGAASSEIADAPRPQTTVMLTLRARPSARVSVGGLDLGETPVSHEIAASDRSIAIVFSRKGYRTEKRIIVPDGNHTIDVDVARRPKHDQDESDGPSEPDVLFIPTE